jgi:hypothetical protein
MRMCYSPQLDWPSFFSKRRIHNCFLLRLWRILPEARIAQAPPENGPLLIFSSVQCARMNSVTISGQRLQPSLEAYGPLKTIPIEQIGCDPVVQPRERLNRTVVRDYLAIMQAGDETFPALHVIAIDSGFLLIDGYHRLEAAKQAKLQVIRCTVHDGDRRQAILLSSSANGRNGLRRTNADKRRAVTKLLSDSEWRQWSDRQIARYCNVSQVFVSGMRAKIGRLTDNIIGDNSLRTDGTQRRFITKHGKPAIMHLPTRQRSSTIASAPIHPLGGIDNQLMTELAAIATKSPAMERACLVEAVDNFEKLIRTTELTSIRVDAALDNALSKQLKALAQLIASKAEMLLNGA